MPTISLFFNIRILMFWNDPAPPHFHAALVGQDDDTIIDIRTLEVIHQGSLKRRALGLVLDWAELHRDELLANWELARERKPLNQIAPLEQMMGAPWNVVKVEVIGPLTLWVEHRDGVSGTVRFTSSGLRGVFEVLKDPDYFGRVGIAHGAVSWPNEMPDLAPDAMHDELARSGEWILN